MGGSYGAAGKQIPPSPSRSFQAPTRTSPLVCTQPPLRASQAIKHEPTANARQAPRQFLEDQRFQEASVTAHSPTQKAGKRTRCALLCWVAWNLHAMQLAKEADAFHPPEERYAQEVRHVLKGFERDSRTRAVRRLKEASAHTTRETPAGNVSSITWSGCKATLK